MAARMSAALGWLKQQDVAATVELIEQAKLPVMAPDTMTTERFMQLMAVDKKVLDGVLRLVLLREIGHAVVTNDYTNQQLEDSISLSLPA
jgi:3-dehydroquinate synthase